MRFAKIMGIIIMLQSGCASMQEVDRGYLNHKGLNLSERKTPPMRTDFSGLESTTSQGSGGCSTCAH